MKKIVVYILAAAGALGVGFMLLNAYIYQEKQGEGGPQDGLVNYENTEYGFSLRHPDSYVALAPEGEGGAVSFYIQEDWEDFLNSPPGREGPPGVTVETFANPESLPVVEWAALDSRSNLALGPGDYVEVEVNGMRGIAYGWSGLYEGLSVALADEERIYMLSVTYLSLQDRIVEDFPVFLEFFEAWPPSQT
ncbi:MAG: hypothetical protein Q8P12_01965 [bacterium]|nr:hypothetical protein [bacterium]